MGDYGEHTGPTGDYGEHTGKCPTARLVFLCPHGEQLVVCAVHLEQVEKERLDLVLIASFLPSSLMSGTPSLRTHARRWCWR